jgi:acetyltransferase-like isoleucine patch superfamily enzyme
MIINKLIRIFTNCYLKAKLYSLGVKTLNATFNGYCYFLIDKKSQFSIGKNLVIQSGPLYTIDTGLYSKIEIKKDGKLIIGNNVGISSTSIHVHNSISIGDNVNIGSGTLIMDTDFHSLNYILRRDRSIDMNYAKTKPIIINNDVFIGGHCIVKVYILGTDLSLLLEV